MQSLSERAAGFTDSVIRRMTRVSLQYGETRLSQGFPGSEPPKEIVDRLERMRKKIPKNREQFRQVKL